MFDFKLIKDYVEGNDIEDFDIDTLENDAGFMISVISYTNDKKMYALCSDELKNNIDFVKSVIKIFKDDQNFIISIGEQYFNNCTKDDDKFEISIFLSEVLALENKGVYALRKTMFYASIKQSLEIVSREISEEQLATFGKGFKYLLPMYSNRKVIVDFFAKKFLEEIFYGSELTLEEIIHKYFKTITELEGNKLEKWLLTYISNEDESLANYVDTHLYLLDDLIKEVEIIKKNWNYYLEALNKRRIAIFVEELSVHMEKVLPTSGYFSQFIDYAVEYLHLEHIYYKYVPKFEIPKDWDVEEIPLNINELNLQELGCLRYTINLLSSLFNQDVILPDLSDYDFDEGTPMTGKILDFRLKTNENT